jgi:hypothetical protein
MRMVTHLARVQTAVHVLGRHVRGARGARGPHAAAAGLVVTVAAAAVERRRLAQVCGQSSEPVATQTSVRLGALVVDLDLVVAARARLAVHRVDVRGGAMAPGARQTGLAEHVCPVCGGSRDGARALELCLMALAAALAIRGSMLGHPACAATELVQQVVAAGGHEPNRVAVCADQALVGALGQMRGGGRVAGQAKLGVARHMLDQGRSLPQTGEHAERERGQHDGSLQRQP